MPGTTKASVVAAADDLAASVGPANEHEPNPLLSADRRAEAVGATSERVLHLIGVKDTPKTRAIQRAVGVQELTTAQGIFSFSPSTPSA